jgi:hypothetical protein
MSKKNLCHSQGLNDKPKRTGPLAVRVFFYRRGYNRRTCAAMEAAWIDHHSKKSLKRLLPRLDDIFDSRSGAAAAHGRQAFKEGLIRHWKLMFRLLGNLYGWHFNVYCRLEQILTSTARAWLDCSVTANTGGNR